MSEMFSRLSQKIAEKLFLSYLIATLATTTLFISLMIVVGWDISAFINPTILLALTLFPGAIQRLLGGVGLLLTFILVSRLSFKVLSNFMKGNKKRARLVKALLLVLAAGICGYAIYRIGSALVSTNPITLIGTLFNLSGVWIAIIWVYFIPAIRSEYQLGGKKRTLSIKFKKDFKN